MNKKQIISLAVGFSTLMTIMSPVTASATGADKIYSREYYENREDLSVTVDEEKVYSFRDETLKEIATIKELIDTAKSNPSKETLYLAIDAFAKPRLSIQDLLAHKSGDDIDIAFEDMYSIIMELPEEERDEALVYYQKKIIESWKIKTIIDGVVSSNNFFYGYANDLYERADNPVVKEELKKGVFDMGNYISNEGYESTYDESKHDRGDGLIPGAPDISKKPDIEKAPEYDKNSSSLQYEKIGNDVYRIIQHYDENGNLVKVEKIKASREEYILAGLNGYLNLGGGVVAGVPEDKKYADSAYRFENLESSLTVQYSLDKDADTSEYYDTGIRTTLSGTVSFDQLSDVLYQVAVKSGGWFVSDTDKFLIVIEGTPVVIYNSKNSYTKDDIRGIFKGFEKIDVTILETRIGKSENLETQVLSKKSDKVEIDGREYTLPVKPYIKNDRLLLPADVIAKELGADVTVKDRIYTIKLNGNEALYESGKNFVMVNGKVILMGSEAEIKDNHIMAEVQDMLTLLGYEIMWDGESGTILVNKIS